MHTYDLTSEETEIYQELLFCVSFVDVELCYFINIDAPSSIFLLYLSNLQPFHESAKNPSAAIERFLCYDTRQS